MSRALSCPRCESAVREPTVWTSAYLCHQHGEVPPLRSALSPSPDGLAAAVGGSRVPAWLPWPLPQGWLVTGFAAAGDERTGARACAVALSGPSPAGGPAELTLVAEEPGVGLGARIAGLDGPDPGARFAASPPAATVGAGGHQYPLWPVTGRDRQAFDGRAAFAGELAGEWLWLVLWPQAARRLLDRTLELRDLRDPGQVLDLPYGAPSPLLPA